MPGCVVVDLVCPEVGPVPAGHTVYSPSLWHQHSFINKLTNQFNEMWSTSLSCTLDR